MLSLTDIEHILTFYTLGKLYGVTQAYRGFVNETAFIQTSVGRFVVRRNHRRLSEAAHRYRHRLINYLVEHAFPTPALVPTNMGDTLLHLDGRLYEIMTYVHGTDYDPQRPQQLLNIGATLAQYHRLTQPFPPPTENPSMRYSASNIMALTEKLTMNDVMGDLYEPLTWYANRAAQLRAMLKDKEYTTLPHLIIHGDIHRDNLLFEHDQVVALLDFDQVAYDARVVDIADALVAFTSTKPAHGPISWGLFQGPLDEKLAARFLSAYTRVFPLTPAEITALPVVLEALWLQGELGRVISTPEGAPDYHQSVLDQGRELSAWMQAHSKQLTMQWNGVNTQSEIEASKNDLEPALAA